MKTCFLALAVLLVLGPGATVAIPATRSDVALVESAFEGISRNYRDDWGFRETRTSGEGEFVGRYDPARPPGERWTLVSVDGRPPTEQEAEDYRADRTRDGDDGGAGMSNADIVADGSLELIASTDETLTYTFTPAGDDDEEFFEDLIGTLTIDRTGRYLHALTLANDKPVRPATGVKISRFRVHLTFASLTPDGPVVPTGVDVSIKGRAYLAIGFDEVEKITWDEYEYAGDRD